MTEQEIRAEYIHLYDVADDAERLARLKVLQSEARDAGLTTWEQLIEARIATVERNYPRAIDLSTPLIEDPQTTEDVRCWAQINRGVTYRLRGGNGDYERAIADYTGVIGMLDAPAEQKAHALVNRGVTYGQRGGDGDVEREISDDTAVIEMPDAPAEQKANALFNRGATYGQRGGEGDVEREVADYTALIEMPDAPVENKAKALVNRGSNYRKRAGEGDLERANADLTAVIDMPDAPADTRAMALISRGVMYRKRGGEGDLARAIADFAAVIEMPHARAVDRAAALLRRGRAYGQRGGDGDIERAIADCTAVIEMPDAPVEQRAAAFLARGWAYGERGGEGDVERAIADLAAVVETPGARVKDKALALVNRGVTYWHRHGEGDVGRAIADYTAVIEMPDVPAEQSADARFNRGVTYGHRRGEGDMEREIADYAAVIEMPDAPAEHRAKALVNRGAAFGRRDGEGDLDRAIANYTAVIEMPDAPAEQKAQAHLNRGVTYERGGGEGDVERAIAEYTAAIEMPRAPLDVAAWASLNRAIAYDRRARKGDHDLAVADLESVTGGQAAIPDYWRGFASAFLGYLRANPEDMKPAYHAFVEARKFGHTEFLDQMRLLATLKSFSPQEVEEFSASVAEFHKTAVAFLLPVSEFAHDSSLLLVLRQWNSYTPAIPTQSEQDLGGGYFLRHNRRGIVIDPGFGFLWLFYRAGGRIADIDNVVVTHAHPDHTAELEALFMLLREYNDRRKKEDKEQKRVRLLWSQDTQRKFSPMLEIWDDQISEVVVLNCARQDSPPVPIFEGCDVTPLATNHRDHVTKGYALGLAFEISFGESREKRRVVFSGDTGLYPPLGEAREDKTDDRPEQSIWRRYPQRFLRPDLLVAHIGSIKAEEFASIKRLQGITSEERPGEKTPTFDFKPYFYPKHLGLFGTYELIEHVEPTLALVSEFGEELRDIRVKVIQRIEAALSRNAEGGQRAVRVFCGDPFHVYDIRTGQLLCHEDCTFADPRTLEMDELYLPGPHGPGKECYVYLFREGTRLLTREKERRIQEFHRRLQARELPHFSDDARKRARERANKRTGDPHEQA